MQSLLNWIQNHEGLLLAILAYVFINVSKRRAPPTSEPYRTAWMVFETFMLLSWDRWGGTLKTVPGVYDGPEVPTKAETPEAKAKQ